MSRTKRFLSGISFGYASQVITTLVGFWLTPFLLFRIGQHDYGLWLVGTQVMFYLGLLDLGLVALLPRETAFATGRASSIAEAADLPLIVGQTTRIVLAQMPLVAIAALVAWFILPTAWEGLRYPIGLVLLAFVLTFPMRIFSAVLRGLQDLAFVGRVAIISYLISTSITVALVLAGFGLYALALGWTVLQLSVSIPSWQRLRRHFPGVLPRTLPKLTWLETFSRLKQGFWVTANQIAQVLLTGTDILIIGTFFGPAAVVPYVITGKLVGVLSNQPQLFLVAAMPGLSHMTVSESRERTSQVCIALTQAMLILTGAVVCVVLAVNQGFVARWVGANQWGGSTLSALILLSVLLRHWNLTVSITLLSFRQEKRLCITAFLDGVVTLVSMLFFTRWFGLIGAPIGAIAGVCLVSLPLNLSVLARETHLSLWRLLIPLSGWFTRFVVLAIAAAALARIWIPGSLLVAMLMAGIVGLVYCAVMFPVALGYPLGGYIRPRLFSIQDRVMRAFRLGVST